MKKLSVLMFMFLVFAFTGALTSENIIINQTIKSDNAQKLNTLEYRALMYSGTGIYILQVLDNR